METTLRIYVGTAIAAALLAGRHAGAVLDENDLKAVVANTDALIGALAESTPEHLWVAPDGSEVTTAEMASQIAECVKGFTAGDGSEPVQTSAEGQGAETKTDEAPTQDEQPPIQLPSGEPVSETPPADAPAPKASKNADTPPA